MKTIVSILSVCVMLSVISGCGETVSKKDFDELKAKLAAKDSTVAAPPVKHGASATATVDGDPGTESIARAYSSTDGEQSASIKTEVVRGPAVIITAQKEGEAKVLGAIKGLKNAEWEATLTNNLENLKRREADLEKRYHAIEEALLLAQGDLNTANKALKAAKDEVAAADAKSKAAAEKKASDAQDAVNGVVTKLGEISTDLKATKAELADVRLHQSDPSTLTVTLHSTGCYTSSGSGAITPAATK